MKITLITVALVISTAIALTIGMVIGSSSFHSEDQNSRLMYGNTGFPKNCRAIIKANYEGWYLKEYTAEAALDSINRNCGEFGYSWNIEK